MALLLDKVEVNTTAAVCIGSELDFKCGLGYTLDWDSNWIAIKI